MVVQAIHAHFFSVFPSRADFLLMLVCPWKDLFCWAGIMHLAVTDRFIGRNSASQEYLFSIEFHKETLRLDWVGLHAEFSWSPVAGKSLSQIIHISTLAIFKRESARIAFLTFIHCCSDHSKYFLLTPGRVARPGGKWMFQADNTVLAMIYRMVLTVVLF